MNVLKIDLFYISRKYLSKKSRINFKNRKNILFIHIKKKRFKIMKVDKRSILENWILIDKILFEDKNPREILGETYQNYLEDKSAFLVNLKEMESLLGFKKDQTIYNSLTEMYDYIEDKIQIAKELTHNFINDPQNIKIIREEVEEAAIKSPDGSKEDIAIKITDKYYKSNIMDYALLKESLRENINNKITNNWKFKLLFNTYKVMRENLINYAQNM